MAASGLLVFRFTRMWLPSTLISVPLVRLPLSVWTFTFDPSGMVSATFRHASASCANALVENKSELITTITIERISELHSKTAEKCDRLGRSRVSPLHASIDVGRRRDIELRSDADADAAAILDVRARIDFRPHEDWRHGPWIAGIGIAHW